MTKVLGLFDRAYVINRDQDVARMTLATERLAKVGIPFQRFSARCFSDRGKHPCAGHRGANASHLAIVVEAKEQNLDSVLIMEDDVIFRENFCDLWSQILPALNHLKYDLFFGYNWRNRGGKPRNLRIVPIQKTLCVHFWAIHSSFFSRFITTALENEDTERPHCIDGIFTNKIARIFAPTYNLVGQDEGISLVMENVPKAIRWSA